MEKEHVKPGRCYKVAANLVIRVVCGAHLLGIEDGYSWLVEAKQKHSKTAKSKWSLIHYPMDENQQYEPISTQEWLSY